MYPVLLRCLMTLFFNFSTFLCNLFSNLQYPYKINYSKNATYLYNMESLNCNSELFGINS